MYNIEFNLDEGIQNFLSNIAEGNSKYEYRNALSGNTQNGLNLRLGYSCYALKIKNFALSFTNSSADVMSFGKLLPNKSSKIYKIETKLAVKNFIKLTKVGSNFLIDRGDLSKDIDIINIPVVQRNIIKIKNNLKNKHVYIATNLLESMVKNNYPTRGEVNDIYSSLEMGSDGLVLAAETAIGKHPIECVKLIKQIINKFNKTF